MKKNYETPQMEIFGTPEETFCATDPESVADALNYKHLTDTTIDLDALEEWTGED